MSVIVKLNTPLLRLFVLLSDNLKTAPSRFHCETAHTSPLHKNNFYYIYFIHSLLISNVTHFYFTKGRLCEIHRVLCFDRNIYIFVVNRFEMH